MTLPDDSVLSEEEIAGRFAALAGDGFPQDGIEQLAMDLATCCRGTVAEEFLAKVLEVLEADGVCRVATAQIGSILGSPTPTNYCDAIPLLAKELTSHGFHVDTSGSWQVNLPDGTQLAPMLRPAEGEDPSLRLCRLALLGVWILGMRSRPEQPPAY